MATGALATSRQIVVGVALMLACGACDDGPGPGRAVAFHVVSPNGPEGAALVEIMARVDDAAPTDPNNGWTLSRTSGDTTWVFVALRTAGDLSFSATVFGSVPPTARVVQVADGEDRLRVLDGYDVRVQP